MAKWRKLHLKVCESLDVNDMPDDFTRLLWVLLPLGLDREGRWADNAALVRSRLMPLREDVSTEQVKAALDWFSAHEMIARYRVKGRAYFYVPTFRRYQGDTSYEAESNYPSPEQADLSASEAAIGLLETKLEPTSNLLETKLTSDSDTDADSDPEKAFGAIAPALEGTEPIVAEPVKAEEPAPPKQARPPRSEAVKAFREIARCWPNAVQIASIDAEVTADTVPRWKDTVRRWMERGYRPTNVPGMLEWFRQGVPPSNGNGRGNGNGHKAQIMTEIPDELLELNRIQGVGT